MSGRCNKCLEAGGVVRMWGAVRWCRQCTLDAGALGRKALARHDHGDTADGYTPEVLKRLAAGPIMDGNAIFLPAGKLTKEEADARDRANVL